MGYAERSYSYRSDGSSGGFGRGRGQGGGRGEGGGFGGLSGSVSPWVLRLLLANGAVFLLMLVGLLPGGFSATGWTIRTLGFSPDAILTRPWSPVTYMFVHGGLLHVGVNMLVLFFFGPPLERAWGGREFLKYYLVAGLGAALASYVFLPLPDVALQTTVVGASGAIFGVMLAFALMWPEARIWIWGILPMRAKWFVGLLAVFTLLSTFRGGGGRVADWAHLGGLVTGFVYLRWGRPVSGALDRVFDALDRLSPGSGGGSSSSRSPSAPGRGAGSGGAAGTGGATGTGGAVGTASGGPGAGGSDGVIPLRGGGRSGEGRGDASEEMLDEVDRILDKIREEGLDALTEEEREFLDEMSRRYRG